MLASFCVSLPVALGGSLALAGGYVASLYVRARFRRSNGRAPDRDEPRVIKDRFMRVGIACAVAPWITMAAVALPGPSASCPLAMPLARWFGLLPKDVPTLLAAAMAPLGLTMVLFLGPLMTTWMDADSKLNLTLAGVRSTGILGQLRASYGAIDLRTLRNLVVGPLSEEWVFRACMCPLLYGAGLSDAASVFISGIFFGLAHVHHVFDADASLVVVAVQFTYTTLFGAYSSYLFLRTGLIYGPVLAHAFCNCMGLPDFGRALRDKNVGLAFVVGLGSFIALTYLDAVHRPPLFGSIMWTELLASR